MSDVEMVPLKQPLSERERSVLSRPALEGAFEQISLEHRIIEHLVIRGQTWTAASWRGLHAAHVRFVDCTLHSVDLRGAVLRDVSFERCELHGCRFGDAKLTQCRFSGGSLRNSRARGAELWCCVFDGVALEGLSLEGTRIEDLRQQGGRLIGAVFSECDLRGWQLSEVELATVKLTLCDVTAATLRECRVDGMSLLGGSWQALSMHGGSLANLSLYDVDAGSLLIERSASVRSLRINQSRLEHCVIAHCLEVFDLYFHDSKSKRLTLQQGRFTGWITACEIGAGSRVEATTLVGFFWDETRATELSFHGVRFEEAICARGARFDGLKLEQVFYEPGCALVLDGASFERSDRFGGDER
jgi:uncharacterized protein YjbI with pentapeptide repeats